jgi:predicted TIM-barrel fold metal-dependent hydrolase
MAILDSHCHAWPRWPYSRAVPDAATRGSGESLLYEMDAHDVAHAVVVCARVGGGAGRSGYANDDNNEYVMGLSRAHPDRLTAWVDVDCEWRAEYHTPGAAARLDAALDASGAQGFTHYFRRGNDGWLTTDDALAFFATAAERGAVASLSLGAEWLDDLAGVLRELPALRVLLHHLGGPRRGSADDVERVAEFARHPAVGVKVSGLHYFAERPWDYPYPDGLRAVERLYRAYGADRLYWGSDFPASVGLLTHTQSIELVRTHCRFAGDDELGRIMGGNLAALLGLS